LRGDKAEQQQQLHPAKVAACFVDAAITCSGLVGLAFITASILTCPFALCAFELELSALGAQ